MDLNLTLFSYKDDRLDFVVKWKHRPQIHFNETYINGDLHAWHCHWEPLKVSTADPDADSKVHDFHVKELSEYKHLSGHAILENDLEKWTLQGCRITNYEIIDEIRLIELTYDGVNYINKGCKHE
jgi:hypothetical protein